MDKVIAELTGKDYRNYSLYYQRTRRPFLKYMLVFYGAIILIVNILMIIGREPLDAILVTNLLILILVSVSLTVTPHINAVFAARANKRGGGYGGPVEYTFEEEGIRTESKDTSSFVKWEAVQSVEEDRNNLYLFVGEGIAAILPKRFFADEEAYRRVAGFLHGKIDSGQPVQK